MCLYRLSRIGIALLLVVLLAACAAEEERDVAAPAPAAASTAEAPTTAAPATTADRPPTVEPVPASEPALADEDEIPIDEEGHADPLPRADPVVLESPVPATRKALDGHVYLIEELVVDGERRDLYGAILIAFDDGRMGVQPGCNGTSGRYTLTRGRMAFRGEDGTTLMLCPKEGMDQDELVSSMLIRDTPRVALDGEKIELRTDDVVLRGRDREVAFPDFPLAGRTYRIAAFVGGDTGRRTEAAWLQQTELHFARDGSFTVRAPCGRFTGEYGVDAQLLSMDFELDGPCFSGDPEVANILAVLWTNPPQPHWLEGDEGRVRLQQDMDGSTFELVAID